MNPKTDRTRMAKTRLYGRPWVIAAVITALYGCQASMPTTPFSKPTASMISEFNAQGGTGKAVLRKDSSRVPRSTVGLSAPHSVVEHARTEKYLKGILGKLLAQVPDNLATDEEIDVFLTSHDGSAHLYATGADDILIGYGTLQSLASEDELAFALAHEIAHILLQHNQNQESIFSLDTAVKIVDKMLMTARTYEMVFDNRKSGAKQLTPEQQRELAKHVSEIRIAAHAIRSSITGVLHGAWSRRQERAADRLGYDLLVAAGFNGEGAGRLLDRLGEEPSLRENVAEHVDKMERAANGLVAITEQNALTAYTKQLGIAGLARATKATLDLVDDTHEDVADRKRELYEDYVDELGLERNMDRMIDQATYQRNLAKIGFNGLKKTLDRAKQGYYGALSGEIPSTPTAIVSGAGSQIGFNRYALYSVRKETNQSKSAMANLRIAYSNRPKDFSTSSQYAVQLAAAGKLEEALEIADLLESTYEADAPLNDVRGRIHKSAGNLEQARNLWNTCDSNKKSYVRLRCERELDTLELETEQIALQQDLLGNTQLAEDPTLDLAPPAAGDKSQNMLDRFKNMLGTPPEK